MIEIIVSEIQIIPIKPQNGLIAFASCVINSQFYIGNIALYSSPSSPSGYRLVFPTKKLSNGKQVNCFHPISKEAGEQVTLAIIKEYSDLMNSFHHITN